MNLPVIEMDRNEARRAFKAYRDEVRQRRDDEINGVRQSIIDRLSAADVEARARVAQEDEALARAYRLVSSGKRIISLGQTIVEGGVTKDGFPKLGIARADQVLVECFVGNDGVAHFSPNTRSRATSKAFTVRGLPPKANGAWETRIADVPRVPAWLRPAGDLSGYSILFEASWRVANQRRAMGDPALLRPLGSDLYAVVAVWDLTALERAVLGLAQPTT